MKIYSIFLVLACTFCASDSLPFKQALNQCGINFNDLKLEDIEALALLAAEKMKKEIEDAAEQTTKPESAEKKQDEESTTTKNEDKLLEITTKDDRVTTTVKNEPLVLSDEPKNPENTNSLTEDKPNEFVQPNQPAVENNSSTETKPKISVEEEKKPNRKKQKETYEKKILPEIQVIEEKQSEGPESTEAPVKQKEFEQLLINEEPEKSDVKISESTEEKTSTEGPEISKNEINTVFPTEEPAKTESSEHSTPVTVVITETTAEEKITEGPDVSKNEVLYNPEVNKTFPAKEQPKTESPEVSTPKTRVITETTADEKSTEGPETSKNEILKNHEVSVPVFISKTGETTEIGPEASKYKVIYNPEVNKFYPAEELAKLINPEVSTPKTGIITETTAEEKSTEGQEASKYEVIYNPEVNKFYPAKELAKPISPEVSTPKTGVIIETTDEEKSTEGPEVSNNEVIYNPEVNKLYPAKEQAKPISPEVSTPKTGVIIETTAEKKSTEGPKASKNKVIYNLEVNKFYPAEELVKPISPEVSTPKTGVVIETTAEEKITEGPEASKYEVISNPEVNKFYPAEELVKPISPEVSTPKTGVIIETTAEEKSTEGPKASKNKVIYNLEVNKFYPAEELVKPISPEVSTPKTGVVIETTAEEKITEGPEASKFEVISNPEVNKFYPAEELVKPISPEVSTPKTGVIIETTAEEKSTEGPKASKNKVIYNLEVNKFYPAEELVKPISPEVSTPKTGVVIETTAEEKITEGPEASKYEVISNPEVNKFYPAEELVKPISPEVSTPKTGVITETTAEEKSTEGPEASKYEVIYNPEGNKFYPAKEQAKPISPEVSTPKTGIITEPTAEEKITEGPEASKYEVIYNPEVNKFYPTKELVKPISPEVSTAKTGIITETTAEEKSTEGPKASKYEVMYNPEVNKFYPEISTPDAEKSSKVPEASNDEVLNNPEVNKVSPAEEQVQTVSSELSTRKTVETFETTEASKNEEPNNSKVNTEEQSKSVSSSPTTEQPERPSEKEKTTEVPEVHEDLEVPKSEEQNRIDDTEVPTTGQQMKPEEENEQPEKISGDTQASLKPDSIDEETSETPLVNTKNVNITVYILPVSLKLDGKQEIKPGEEVPTSVGLQDTPSNQLNESKSTESPTDKIDTPQSLQVKPENPEENPEKILVQIEPENESRSNVSQPEKLESPETKPKFEIGTESEPENNESETRTVKIAIDLPEMTTDESGKMEFEIDIPQSEPDSSDTNQVQIIIDYPPNGDKKTEDGKSQVEDEHQKQKPDESDSSSSIEKSSTETLLNNYKKHPKMSNNIEIMFVDILKLISKYEKIKKNCVNKENNEEKNNISYEQEYKYKIFPRKVKSKKHKHFIHQPTGKVHKQNNGKL